MLKTRDRSIRQSTGRPSWQIYKAFGQIVPQVTERSTEVSLNKPAIAEADRTNWYESPSAIVQADRVLKLHPALAIFRPHPPVDCCGA